MERIFCSSRDAQSGLILLMPRCEKAVQDENKDREVLFAEGFRRMGWPDYDASMIWRTEYGKPVYTGKDPYYFNYSDTRGWCGAVFAPLPCGIDLEGPRRRSGALLKRLPEAERICLFDAADEAPRERRFARMWTAKEAFCKMTGRGITKEILETSFAECIAQIDPLSFAPGEEAVRMPPEAALSVCACGTDAKLLQLYAGCIAVSVCTERECAFEIAFSDCVR